MGFDRKIPPYHWYLESTRPPYDEFDRKRWARSLGVSANAIDLVLDNDVVDLHVDTFIWTRLLGYKTSVWHERGPFLARFCGQADVPRLSAASINGAVWVITTNPFRSSRNRLRTLITNYTKLCSDLLRAESRTRIVRRYSEYVAARNGGMHAAFLAIQGGNALSDPESARVFPLDRLLLTTLVHLTNNDLGDTSSPIRMGQQRGLLPRGRELIFELESKRVWVDLAHASKKTFWDAVKVHDRSRPLLVSHTAFSSLTPHWRNLDDDQARAITDSGGLIGILYHGPFLGESSFDGTVATIARHLAYGVKRFGAEHICLGSDWDGMIAPPIDMPTCLELPRLVEALNREGLSSTAIRQILGGSFLRLLKETHP